MKTFFAICFCFLWSIAHAQVKVPGEIIGNWVREADNSWEYGFYEEFAVFESGFWEYEFVQVKNKQVEIQLKKGGRQENLKLRLPNKAGSPLTIARNKGKSEKFRPNRPGFFPYTTADQRPFKQSGFKPDTVTIVGYYRNLANFNKTATLAKQKGPFKVSVPNFIMDESAIEYFADFDSLGRFTIKFPVLNTQQVYLDWGRLTQMDVVEPGETIFLFADMADYHLNESDMTRQGMMAFRNRPKHLLYMGQDARLHNEIANYKEADSYFDRQTALKNITSDLDYLIKADTNYQTRVSHLENYIKSQPALSDRFKTYQHAYEKYQLAFHLMQYRFDKRSRQDIAFDKGYMEFINEKMDFNDEQLFTLVREYSTFMRDYIGYHSDLGRLAKDEKTGKMRSKGISVADIDVLQDLKSQGYFDEKDKKVLADFVVLTMDIQTSIKEIKDTAQVAALMKPYRDTFKSYMAIVERPELKEALPELRTQLLRKKMRDAELQRIDSLIQHKTLKELLVARTLYHAIDHARIPLSKNDLDVLNNKVTLPPIKDYILGVNNHYIALGKKEISYAASLVNTDHLKESRDADLLFSQLLAPYKGKVVFVDFWGTWCGPCLQQMPFAGTLKKELAGKDVIFMYLANNSPEKSWKNVIKQMDIAGENVVHYRLPQEQQAMIERKLGVNSFPRYLLIGKDGKVAQHNAPRPELKEQLVSAIDKLLAE